MNVVFIDTESKSKAKIMIDNAFKENKFIIVKARDNEFNRKIVENKKVNCIFDLELANDLNKIEPVKWRDSGLNSVLCRLAKKNEVSIGINLNTLKNYWQNVTYLSRLIQNIRLCNKYRNKVVLINLKDNDERNIFSLLLCLGLDTKMAKEAVLGNIDLN
ncbi:MAG: hypothetical protein QXJ28_01080 [Candidatus Pacearchaeota archaeon]